MADGISGKVVGLYSCHRGLKHAVTESCRRRRTSHPAVLHELDDCMHHIDSVFTDVVNPTVP